MDSKVILVTGAARRIGRVVAEWFGAQGYDVAVHYNASAAEAQQVADGIVARGQQACALHADLAVAAQAADLVARVYERFGRLDVLVNCASVFGHDRFDDFEIDEFDRAWATNGRAPLLLARAFYLRARAAGSTGAVINVIDQKVRDNFHADHFSYTVGKAALGNLTKMLALSAHPVLRVNAVYPGLALPSDDQSLADFEYASLHSTPLARIAGPQDLARAIELLVGEGYNGVDFTVDGGQHLRRVDRDVLYLHRDPARSGE
ncbi:SDR family oxidoreductase [Paraburkholderia sp.]|jgi:pteridine reductase|uniref:SDR family oxidoreductase n=1 Tax=Paraburkholderia sp. TaxID=1926495 RepID=UPI002605A6D0|nr:SDR family oxidoreductase [Paraburkholderia sp.]